MEDKKTAYKLPKPIAYIQCDLNYAIGTRRSIRSYKSDALTHQQISNILWSCQGITDTSRNYRAAPSAGATYPFDIYCQIMHSKDIENGIYFYKHDKHELLLHKKGDLRAQLTRSCFNQAFINQVPFIVVLVAEPRRTSARYGNRATRYIAMEAGHIGQNIYLESLANELATVAVGAFNDADVKSLLSLEHDPLYIFPIGKPA